MKSNLYVIHDSKAKRTTEPFSCPSDESAIRNHLFGCFASETPPQDTVLFCVGSFSVDDTESTEFSVFDTRVRVVPVSVEQIEAYHKLYCEYFDFEKKSEVIE